MSIQAYDINLAPAGSQGSTQIIEATAQICDFLTSGSAFDQIEVRPNFTQGAAVLKLGQGFDFGKPVDRWLIVNKGATAVAGQVMLSTAGFRNFRISGDVNVLDGGKSRTQSGSAFMANMFVGGTAGQYSAIQLWNPTGSGKRQIVESIAINSTVQGAMQFFINAVELTGSIGPGAQSKLSGGALSAALNNSQTSATLWAGNYMGSAFLQANLLLTFTLKEPIVLLPGYGLIIAQQVVASALQAVVEFYEEPNT